MFRSFVEEAFFRPLAISVGTGPFTADALPLPLPGGVQIAPALPIVARPFTIVGTEGDDRLLLPGGANAIGAGGDDVFVLSSRGDTEGVEQLGSILDFSKGDTLDVSGLGEKAKILGSRALDRGEGQRFSIDYDGDGDEDGFVLAYNQPALDVGGFRPYPMPSLDGAVPDGEVRIMPVIEAPDLTVDVAFFEAWVI
jgi:hypothetical protein